MMGAFVKVVPQADWDVLMRYMNNNGVVLMPENIAQEKNIPEDGLFVEDYDFGGEADVLVDLARTTEHFLFDQLSQQENE